MERINNQFWKALDELVSNSEIVIDRPKGSAHSKYSDFIYKVDYGYLGYRRWRHNRKSMGYGKIRCSI